LEDDDELDDDVLLNELDGMDQEGKAAAKNKVEQLLKSVESEKLNAVKEKKAENIEKAKQHLQLMKQH